jgi:hypothetical protein
MTPCLNAFFVLTRILGVAGLALVLVAFWQRSRFEKYLLARWSKICRHPRRRFWLWVTGGAALFSLQPFFFERCTGFHLPVGIHILTALCVFAMFVGAMWLTVFTMPRYHARNPAGSLRLGFILLAVAGILFLAGLYMDLLR